MVSELNLIDGPDASGVAFRRREPSTPHLTRPSLDRVILKKSDFGPSPSHPSLNLGSHKELGPRNRLPPRIFFCADACHLKRNFLAMLMKGPCESDSEMEASKRGLAELVASSPMERNAKMIRDTVLPFKSRSWPLSMLI